MSPLTGPSNVFDSTEKACGEHSTNSGHSHSISADHGKESAEYHLPHRQRAIGSSPEYSGALSTVTLYPQKPRRDSVLYRIKALEEEVRTIKALAMSEDKEQDHKRMDKLVNGVRRAKRIEAAVQKIPVAKGHQHSILQAPHTKLRKMAATMREQSDWIAYSRSRK